MKTYGRPLTRLEIDEIGSRKINGFTFCSRINFDLKDRIVETFIYSNCPVYGNSEFSFYVPELLDIPPYDDRHRVSLFKGELQFIGNVDSDISYLIIKAFEKFVKEDCHEDAKSL